MNTGFPNPIAGQKGKSMKSPWNFDQPHYDERSSCYVNAGSHHGVGHKNPIGHTSEPKMDVLALPRGKAKAMKVDDTRMVNERLDVEE